MLYGGSPNPIPISEVAQEMSSQGNFEIKAFKIGAAAEQRRAPRIVRLALIQNSIVKPTTDPIVVQYKAIEDSVRKMLDAAGAMGANIACLQVVFMGKSILLIFFCMPGGMDQSFFLVYTRKNAVARICRASRSCALPKSEIHQ